MADNIVTGLQTVTLRSVGKPVIVLSDKPGQKIRRGVLRFFGTVEFASGQFCGIELENAEGKHNGSFKGIRYFQCSQDHGIFVLSSKVFADPNVSRARPLSNIISTSRPLKNPGTHGSFQSQIKKSTSQNPEEIPSNSNLFDILNTLNKDSSTYPDTNDQSNIKSCSPHLNHSFHKSASSGQLYNSRNMGETVSLKPQLLTNVSARISTKETLSKQSSFKRPKSISGSTNNKNILATPIVSNLSKNSNLNLNPPLDDPNQDNTECLVSESKCGFCDNDPSGLPDLVHSNTSTPNNKISNNPNSHSDFLKYTSFENIFKSYKLTPEYTNLLSILEQTNKFPNIVNIFDTDLDFWDKKLFIIFLGYRNLHQIDSVQLCEK